MTREGRDGADGIDDPALAGQRADPTEAPPGRRAIRLLISAATLGALGVLGYELASAPIAGVSDAAACDRAYAHARTHADSNVVHHLSYPDSNGRDSRCGLRNLQVSRGIGRN